MKTVIMVYDQGYVSGGAAKIAIGEAVALKEKGWNVVFFCGVGPIAEELTSHNIEVICTNEKHIGLTKDPRALIRGIWNRHAKKALSELLSKYSNKETIVHIHGWTKCLSSSILIAAKNKECKTIVTMHDYFIVCPNGGLYNYKLSCICNKEPGSFKCHITNCDKRAYYQKLYRNVRHIMQKKAFRKCSPSVIYISDFSKKKLKTNQFVPHTEYLLDNFVNIRDYKRIQVENNKVYLFIGRLSLEKGINLFCEAIRKTQVKGIVIGNGPLFQQYKELYPEIDFVGWKNSNEMLEYLEKTRALIVASVLYETMGLTVVEMMSYGIPCIVPQECAPAAYVKNDYNGMYFSVGDKNTLEECILQMNNDDIAKSMSMKNYKPKLLDKFSLDSHIGKLEYIYRKELDIE